MRKKHTLILRLEYSIYKQLKNLAEVRGYKSLNKMINSFLKETISMENKLPKEFYKPIKVKSYRKVKREEIYENR